eukprot:TRINITY_DN360_c0_g1_i2.p1 TRINITY_DN360_c0_g1~~TRINITY_DN360_c0_g1_i2.p1  ORF type:complete len:348 (+),score=92.98 TRINITY_DN360_c0_g1_i2:63-1106(+)
MYHAAVVVAGLAARSSFPGALTPGNCTFYQTNSTTSKCGSNCGDCFNPGARAGVMCKGQGSQTGYYCPSDVSSSGMVTFACMDWTFGSQAMLRAEQSFNKRAGDNVYFGIGTFGTSDAQRGLGACFRLKVDTVDREIIAQSVNTGSDVSGNQFDLQVGDGGAGAFNNCAGGAGSMFPGSYDAWGKQYGGVDNREQCAGLPKYPQSAGPMKAAGDDLVSLCQYSFDKKVRGEGGSNPTLLDATRVKCPEELVEMTQIQRNDEPSSHLALAEHRLAGFPNADVKCQASKPGGGTAYCLTRMMDCRKPSGAFKDNIQSGLVVAGKKLVQTCTQDGYTRIDVQCGCADCYC